MSSPMDKPNQVYPSSPMSSQSPMPLWIPDPSLKGASFDQLIQNRGIRFIHRKFVACPNIQSLDDNSHDVNCPFCDRRGFLKYSEIEVYGLFHSNAIERQFEQGGVWEIGNSVVTLPTEYADGTQADFSIFDQLVILDFEVRMWEIKEYIPHPNKKQNVRYPIKKVEYMSSVKNGVLKIYQVGVDFNLSADGQLVWVVGKEPTYNVATNRGEVYVISYWANPVYNVLQPLRELRISQEMQADNTKVARRLPQSVLVKRDFLVNKTEGLA